MTIGFSRLLSTWGGGARSCTPREGYALWAENYPPLPHNPLMDAEQAAVVPMIESAKPDRALDAGTGTGRYLPVLHAAGARVVVGVDASMAMLGRATAALPRVCGDACRVPFGDSTFDLVCSSLMAGDLPDLASWIREASRILEPGGHLVYSDFHPSWRTERWRRTFRAADGSLCELPFFPHTIEEHLTLLARASFVIRTIREPRARGAQQAPVVVAFHAIKPGHRRPIRVSDSGRTPGSR